MKRKKHHKREKINKSELKDILVLLAMGLLASSLTIAIIFATMYVLFS